MLQIEESRKKKELQIAQRKTPIGNITSTFNLEEKWRDARKAVQRSEMDCYQYNIEHLNKVVAIIRPLLLQIEIQVLRKVDCIIATLRSIVSLLKMPHL